MKRVSVALSAIFLVIIFPQLAYAANTHLFAITSIDTMKYSRDASADPAIYDKIPTQVKLVAESGSSHIAIDTPYDSRFLPVLTAWVNEARANHLSVWFRGNFSGWEGWFNTPKFSNYKVDHKLIYKFITSHPNLFETGDIFTPVPEPENGVIGDPRMTDKADQFNQFLIDSYNNCNLAFKTINKSVTCGYFSVNGDIAKQILTPETVKKIGDVVVIDDYVKTPDQLISDINFLHQKLQAPIVLGEYGVPIPDLNGNMTEGQQSTYISSLLSKLYLNKNMIGGLNYWVLNGGSTALINADGTPRQAFAEIKKYYDPIIISGQVVNNEGQVLKNVTVQTQDQITSTRTDNQGYFSLSIPARENTIIFKTPGYISQVKNISEPLAKNYSLRIFLNPSQISLWDKFKLALASLITRIKSLI